MKSILLVTTKGCAACTIMNRLIKEALANTKQRIEYNAKDVKGVNKELLLEHNITDFPATFFFKDDDVRYVCTGTQPAVVINRYIDIYLK